MKNRFLYIALALSMIVLAWLASIYMSQNRMQIQYTRKVEHTYQVIITLRNCEQFLSDAETFQRGYLLTHDQHYDAPFRSAIRQADSAMNRMKELVADNATQRVQIKMLENAVEQRRASLISNLALKPTDKDFLDKLQYGELIMDKIRLYVQQMENVEYDLLSYRSKEKNRYEDLNISFLKYAFIFAAFVFCCSIAMIVRELRIRVRTQKMLEKSIFELKRSNEEIEQVSFAASHDLQEPLRKIRTLSTLLTKKFNDRLSSDEKDIISRIDRSTERMHGLLENLIDFTNLVTHPEKQTLVNLDHVFNQCFEQVMADQDTILNKPVPLPDIKGYEQQVSLLFIQLLTNAVKYKHPDRGLTIDVSYDIRTQQQASSWFWQSGPITQYHRIAIRDNGIGFDSSFSEKIFVMFQRLHNQAEYSGQGIGLTIARRIMTNHYGFIEAKGEKGKGAIFTLWFPFS